MKKRTKKSPKEVHQSNSPSRPGSSGGLSRVKSELETFFNKLSNKLLSKPPSRSTSPFPSTSTGNPGGGTVIGKSTISSAGTPSIMPSQIPQWLSLRVLRLKFHLIDQELITDCQHCHYRLLRKWFKVSDLATQRYSSDWFSTIDQDNPSTLQDATTITSAGQSPGENMLIFSWWSHAYIL